MAIKLSNWQVRQGKATRSKMADTLVLYFNGLNSSLPDTDPEIVEGF